MSRVRTGPGLAVLLLFLSMAAGADAQAPAPPVLSVGEYVDWLDSVVSAVGPSSEDRPSDLTSLIISIPPAWRVESSGQLFDASNGWLVRNLRALQAKPDAVVHNRVLVRLRALGAEAVSFEQPSADASAARARLNDILSRREFQGIHGPTWRDRLRQRILQLIVGLLDRLFGSSAIPTISDLLVYTMIGIAVIVLAMWTYRSIGRSAAVDSVVPGQLPVSQKEWSIWFAEAQSAAARGHWREAVHLSYWCAISYLEGSGAWRPDRARTPREYLRLMPASSATRPGLAALTRSFELVWYGTDRADERTFAEALALLEKMGCPPA